MTSDIKSLTPSSVEFVGMANEDGGQSVQLPKFRDDVMIRISAWAMGYGDADYAGSTAFLKLSVNGAEIASLEDANFNLYSLQVERAIVIPKKTETKVEMASGNHLATQAGDPAHGFVVTVETM